MVFCTRTLRSIWAARLTWQLVQELGKVPDRRFSVKYNCSNCNNMWVLQCDICSSVAQTQQIIFRLQCKQCHYPLSSTSPHWSSGSSHKYVKRPCSSSTELCTSTTLMALQAQRQQKGSNMVSKLYGHINGLRYGALPTTLAKFPLADYGLGTDAAAALAVRCQH